MRQKNWWESAVFYQIYPRSFADSTGNGIGDVRGMISKLDYLASLGIDGIWLSPHYPSPQFDLGYDISDYTDVNPEYGTLEDFQAFLDGCHERDIKLILDLVLNHTSHLHKWFLESSSSLDNPKRDWYIWRAGKKDGPPNNWISVFGGSAWEYDERTGQYYYHFFAKEQPDLNWRNPEVKKAMFDAVRFWLEMGVDGFRLDAIDTIYEDPDLPDHQSPISHEEVMEMVSVFYAGEATPEQMARKDEIFDAFETLTHYQNAQPGVHELMQELRGVIDEYDNRMLVGETAKASYYGDGSNELHQTFNFPLMQSGKLSPQMIIENQSIRLGECPQGCWPANTFNNHDGSRLLNRASDGKHPIEMARLVAALVLTLKGTPYLYNGEEIAMSNYVITDPSKLRDTQVDHMKATLQKQGLPEDEINRKLGEHSRDICRTPMQWKNAPNAGFSPEDVETWLPVNPNYADGINVEDQEKDPNSHLNFYRKLIAVHKNNPALQTGDYTAIDQQQNDYLAFVRMTDQQTILVVLNFSEKIQKIDFSQLANQAKNLYSSDENKRETLSLQSLLLTPFEILITELLT